MLRRLGVILSVQWWICVMWLQDPGLGPAGPRPALPGRTEPGPGDSALVGSEEQAGGGAGQPRPGQEQPADPGGGDGDHGEMSGRLRHSMSRTVSRSWVASPVILCHKGPARVSKVPYEERSFRTQKDGSFCLLLSCSLWHKITGKTMNQWPMRTNPRWTSTNESGEHWCEERREQSGSRMEKIKTKLGILTSRSFLGAFLIAEPLNILLSCSGLSMLMFYSGTKTGANLKIIPCCNHCNHTIIPWCNHTIIPWCNHTIIPWWYYFWWYYWIRIISESESESYNHSIQSLHDDIISVEDWLI